MPSDCSTAHRHTVLALGLIIAHRIVPDKNPCFTKPQPQYQRRRPSTCSDPFHLLITSAGSVFSPGHSATSGAPSAESSFATAPLRQSPGQGRGREEEKFAFAWPFFSLCTAPRRGCSIHNSRLPARILDLIQPKVRSYGTYASNILYYYYYLVVLVLYPNPLRSLWPCFRYSLLRLCYAAAVESPLTSTSKRIHPSRERERERDSLQREALVSYPRSHGPPIWRHLRPWQ
jgi:hypothetical protein